MRIVEEQDRAEVEIDPVEAYRRGRALDNMLRSAVLPVKCGVMHGTHGYFKRLDAERQAQTARALTAC